MTYVFLCLILAHLDSLRSSNSKAHTCPQKVHSPNSGRKIDGKISRIATSFLSYALLLVRFRDVAHQVRQLSRILFDPLCPLSSHLCIFLPLSKYLLPVQERQTRKVAYAHEFKLKSSSISASFAWPSLLKRQVKYLWWLYSSLVLLLFLPDHLLPSPSRLIVHTNSRTRCLEQHCCPPRAHRRSKPRMVTQWVSTWLYWRGVVYPSTLSTLI